MSALGLQRGEHSFRTRPIGCAFKPDLRLRNIRRHVADNALHMLVEDVRYDARVLQAMQQQVRVEAVKSYVEALHVAMLASAAIGAARRSGNVSGDPAGVKSSAPSCPRA